MCLWEGCWNVANQSYEEGSSARYCTVLEHSIRIHLSCKWRQRFPPKRGDRLTASGMICKTRLKQYCENRMKQFNTVNGQNEFNL